MTGSVYFMQQAPDGCIKIGWTGGAVSRRRDNLQIGNHCELVVVGIIAGVPKVEEARWHRQFQHLRERAEWFRPAPDLLAAIQKHAAIPAVARRVKYTSIQDGNLGIGPPAMIAFRAGLLRGDFTLRDISNATGIPVSTLSYMAKPNWGRKLFEKLARLEAALDLLEAESAAAANTGIALPKAVAA